MSPRTQITTTRNALLRNFTQLLQPRVEGHMATGFWKHQCRGSLASCTSPLRGPPSTGQPEPGGPVLAPPPFSLHKEFSIRERREPHPETQHSRLTNCPSGFLPSPCPTHQLLSFHHRGPHLCGHHFPQLCWCRGAGGSRAPAFCRLSQTPGVTVPGQHWACQGEPGPASRGAGAPRLCSRHLA